MPRILNGTARDPGGGALIWNIMNGQGAVTCQFSHLTFSHILHGAAVKFVDDDCNPGMAEQVWAASQVDPLVIAATPRNGATDMARERLEFYVMNKLLIDLLNQRSGASSSIGQLPARLMQLQNQMDATSNSRATIADLQSLGL